MSAPVLPTLLRRVTLRHWLAAPGQTLLLILILALGVGVFGSIRLANRAAISSFSHFTDTLTGQSDWIITAPGGTLPESVLGELLEALGPTPVHLIPVVEATLSTPPQSEDDPPFGRPTYTVLGLDLIALANLAETRTASFLVAETRPDSTETPDGGGGFARLFGEEPLLWINPSLLQDDGQVPATLDWVLDERILTLQVAGVIPTLPEAPPAPAGLLVMDLPQLQTLTGKQGRLDRIEFVVEAGPHREARSAALQARLIEWSEEGRSWLVTTPGAERDSAEVMTRAFRLNLTVLSLISLLVGLYLIFQALDGAVVRRRSEIAILRSLGVKERQIRLAWLLESGALGLLGGSLGVLLSWGGAQLAVRAVGRTVNALYFSTTVQSATPSLIEVGLGLGLGVGAALLAGWWPAREAARTPPAQVLQRSAAASSGAAVWRSAGLGAGLGVTGAALAFLPAWRFADGASFPVAGYAAAFCWIFGAGILCSFLLPPFARVFKGWGQRSAPVKIALSHLAHPSGRHRLAAAALLCAVAMTAGMAVLVSSFETTVKGWVAQTLQADLYLSSAGAQSASSVNRISPEAAEAIANHPAVAAAGLLVVHPIRFQGTTTVLSGADLANPASRPALPWISTPRDDRWTDPAHNEGLVLASESFSERFRLRQGDRLTLDTPAGQREMLIAGVFANYGNERGALIVERAHVNRWFDDQSVTNLSLFVKPGVEPDALRAELAAHYTGLAIFTNSRLRDEVLRIFRQTFSITYALELIGVAVAVLGLGLTLASVLLDRRDQLTTLRALGFGHREIARATAFEGFAVAACASLGGILLSLGLGWLLIYVINKQSFGWTLAFVLPWARLGLLACVVSATGFGVSYFVGQRGADLPADREE